jgi:hypothetical protein
MTRRIPPCPPNLRVGYYTRRFLGGFIAKQCMRTEAWYQQHRKFSPFEVSHSQMTRQNHRVPYLKFQIKYETRQTEKWKKNTKALYWKRNVKWDLDINLNGWTLKQATHFLGGWLESVCARARRGWDRKGFCWADTPFFPTSVGHLPHSCKLNFIGIELTLVLTVSNRVFNSRRLACRC